MKLSVRHRGQAIGLILVATVLYCQQPVEPDSADQQRGIETSGTSTDQVPEEEILGSVFSGSLGIPSTSREYSVRLTPIGAGACIFRANASSTCLSSSSMPVMPKGSRPGKTSPMWGWFNNLDTDNNPCRGATTDKTERHDLNHNQMPDDGTIVEQHCVKPGRYKVEVLRFGSVVRTRVIDHFRVSGTLNLKAIENPAGTQTNDTFVHTEVSTSVPVSNNVIAVDNPETPTAFAPGDTVVHANIAVRFDSRATTTWSGDSRGELMNRVYFDLDGGFADRTEYWNPDRVMRAHPYPLGASSQKTFRTRTEIATPSDPTGDTDRNSPERRIVVQSAVASVTVSPSSATITTQNGTVTLTATLQDANGNILTGRDVSWSSSNTTVATVSGSGSAAIVTGRENGTATISATSEGQSGSSTITVNFPTGTDGAAANGNTFPSSMSAGGIVSVTLSMTNTGTTTWTAADGYRLVLIRNVDAWLPIVRSLSSSVGPGASTTFAFDLRHIEPEITGSVPAFYGMEHGTTVFGAENGRNISIAGPKGGALAAFTATETQSLSATTVVEWIANAEDAGASSLPITPDALRTNGTVVLEYTYDHAISRALDTVLKFTFDPQVIEALAIQPAEGVVDLVATAGLVASGEYWVRLTGTVPTGQGLIVGLPFRLVAGAKPPQNQELGTLTIYYPGAN